MRWTSVEMNFLWNFFGPVNTCFFRFSHLHYASPSLHLSIYSSPSSSYQPHDFSTQKQTCRTTLSSSTKTAFPISQPLLLPPPLPNIRSLWQRRKIRKFMTSSQIPIHAIHQKSQQSTERKEMSKVQGTRPPLCGEHGSVQDGWELYPWEKRRRV